MALTNENVGPKIIAKIKIYVPTRAKLLFKVCYEIPCTYMTQMYSVLSREPQLNSCKKVATTDVVPCSQPVHTGKRYFEII